MANNPPLAVVTGGAGFIGSHLAAKLLELGWQVRCIVKPTTNTQWLTDSRIERVVADIADPRAFSTLEKAMEGAANVFHLAGVSSSSSGNAHARVNVGGTAAVISAVQSSAPQTRFVYCSSLAAAGPNNRKRPINETDPPAPISSYGRSKLTAEGLVEAARISYAIVRPPPVYGPHDRGFLRLFRLISLGVAPYFGSRAHQLSIVHVDDLVHGTIAAAEGNSEGVYYLTDGVVHTWDDILNAIATSVGKKPRAFDVPPMVADVAAKVEWLRTTVTRGKPLLSSDLLAELSQKDYTCDDSFARLDLGYVSVVNLTDGMRSTADWYRSAGWIR